ncbi:hypothetical protein [Phycicoccus sp.]|uniref:hypothetical protein n=1 Tax=Phycicoccus sp. TaxID=1902410 RepID=UPI002C78B91F|nr:hypothetical protein [Phycicoccus sp.]HMM96707.1 hypothetical protein [Phycicoccus sp.]
MATNIAARIRGVLGSPASGLVSVPEIERDSTPDAIRKLQIQIFELSDELVRVHQKLDSLQRGR